MSLTPRCIPFHSLFSSFSCLFSFKTFNLLLSILQLLFINQIYLPFKKEWKEQAKSASQSIKPITRRQQNSFPLSRFHCYISFTAVALIIFLFFCLMGWACCVCCWLPLHASLSSALRVISYRFWLQSTTTKPSPINHLINQSFFFFN